MADLFEPSCILYFLVLPMIIGMGIDTRYKYRYALAMSFGLAFFLFCCLWDMYVEASSLSEIEPIIILILIALSMLMVGIIFEWKSDSSLFQRNALVFFIISVAGLPLYMIKYIVEGKAGIGYPGSLLPLLQFTLALIALVVVTNVFEMRLYRSREGEIEGLQRHEEDEFQIDYEAMDEREIERSLYGDKITKTECGATELEDLEFDRYLDKL